MKIISVVEDDKYFAVEIEKVDFQNAKNIDKTFQGAVLHFMNSSAKLVFYRKTK